MAYLGSVTGPLEQSVKTMGVVATAFFVLLGFLIYVVYNFFVGATLAHERIVHAQEEAQNYWVQRVDVIERNNAVSAYLLGQICKNGADTEAERIACVPPPSL